MSLALNHIPCPAGSSCTAFKCIFGHPNAAEKETHRSPNRDMVREKGGEGTGSTTQDGPRKRQKVNNAQTSVEHAIGTEKASSPALKSLHQSISPPSVKRHSESAGERSNNPRLTSSSKPALAAKPNPKPNKPESLNPRLLKSPPASHEVRFKLLKMLHQEFQRLNTELQKVSKKDGAKLILPGEDLVARALDLEQITALEKGAVYANVMKNKVMHYKRMKVAQWKEERLKEVESAQRKRRQSETSDEPKTIETGLTAAQEVQFLERLLTPIDDLSNHGYVPQVPSEEALIKAREGTEAAKGWEKCDRCQQRFQVFPGRREEDGALTSGGSCKFHWGKPYIPAKDPLGDGSRLPKRYQCCGQEVGDSAGCHTHNHHVYKISDPKRLASISNFARTPPNPSAPVDRAVCFDCEMGYTVYGLELIRLTATSWPSGEELLDVLVRPLGEILDLNSRYSGVWPDDLAQAETWSPGDELKPTKSGDATGSEDGEVKPSKGLKIVPSPEIARDLLFSLISPSTPLIGHGLENDLNSVRIVHPTIIDTILLFPHNAGLPFRFGLKALMDKHLNRKIQQTTGPKMLGHDSAEDARAAGDLVRLKVMNLWKDLQRTGGKIVDGKIVLPGETEDSKGRLTEEFIES